ncbi:MAG: hypothetical protein AAF799_16040 [Myxococcota bacterium]
MPLRLSHALLVLGFGTLGCSTDAPPEDPWGPFVSDASRLAALAATPDLDIVHRDLAVVCPPGANPSHRVGTSTCSVSTIDDQGQLTPLGVEQVLFAQRLDLEHILVGTTDLGLRRLANDGTSHAVAQGVLDPRVADDRRHVAWVELVEPGTGYEMGAATQIVLWDAIDDERWVVSDESSDSSPIPVPEQPEVVLVSRRSGLASYWLVGPEREPLQLTNVGLERPGEGFVPLHAGEFIWLPDGRHAVFSADYGEPEVWLLDLDDPGARWLGPGRMPTLRRGGGVLAVVGQGDALEVVEYEAEVLP